MPPHPSNLTGTFRFEHLEAFPGLNCRIIFILLLTAQNASLRWVMVSSVISNRLLAGLFVFSMKSGEESHQKNNKQTKLLSHQCDL